jgi:uncharacterized protein with PQ loop repeat
MEHLARMLPVLAAGFAIPQYLPQLLRLIRTRDAEGVSFAWPALACVNNGAWFAYFIKSSYGLAPVTAAIATFGAGATALVLARLGRASAATAGWVGTWLGALVIIGHLGGMAFLGVALSAAAAAQLAPSVWAAYRTRTPTGVSLGTWLLVLGEMSCWGTYGWWRSDPRLLVLGVLGCSAAALMVARVTAVPAVLAASTSSSPS